MSTDLPRFLLEATLVWAALLLFYLVAFHRNAHWRGRRRFLLTAFGLGVLIPLLPAISLSGPVAAARLPADLVGYIIPTAGAAPITAADSPAYTWVEVTLAIWAAGALLYLTIAVFGLLRHLRPAAPIREMYAGFRVIRSARVSAPYAAFGRIYLPTALPPALERTALLHEAAHLRHGHPYERLLLLAGTAVFWFHPLSWVYARLLSEVHEYEADAEVTRHIPVKTYGRQLLQATLAPRLVPALFSSPLKKRIMMLTTPTLPRRLNTGSWLVLLGLVTGLVAACSDRVDFDEDQVFLNALNAQIEDLPPRLDEHFRIETMWHETLDTIYRQISYPAAAREQGLYGSILTQVLFDEFGNVTETIVPAKPRASGVVGNDLPVTVVAYTSAPMRRAVTEAEEPNPLLDEADRIATYLAGLKFKPAITGGVPTPSSIYISFSFKLEE